MKQLLALITVLFLLAGGVWVYKEYSVYAFPALSQPAVATQSSSTENRLANGSQTSLGIPIRASGKLMPMVWANLSSATGGHVKAIHVTEGDWVQKGDLLLELSNDSLTSRTTMAEANVKEAEAAHARLLAGASEWDLTIANASLSAAKAKVAIAEGQLQEIQKLVISSQADLAIIQAEYRELVSRPTEAEVTAATARLDAATAAVSQANAIYNEVLVRGDPNINAQPEALALQEATEMLTVAQAEYAVATQGATPEQVAVAAARVEKALANIVVMESQIPTAEATAAAALAGVESAQADLDKLSAGASQGEIAVSEARVLAAQAELANAESQLVQLQLVAPFDGQVTSIYMNAGEIASPEQPLILLGDTRAMQVETTDLWEVDVAELALDQAVEITFDALPGKVLQGTVAHIAPISDKDSTRGSGDTVYTVTIDLDDLDDRLRWGMTAYVSILGQKDPT